VDVVVAGAGIIGCAVAYELSRRGFRTQVFDSRQVGGGATYATAGVLAPFIEAAAAGRLRQLTLESFRLYDDFVTRVRADSGIDVEYRHCGTLEVAADDEHQKQLNAVADLARAAGFLTEWLDAAPRQGSESRGLLIPSQGYVRVEQLIVALRQAAERHAARFHEGEPIERVGLARDEIEVHTARQRLTCAALVIAAGSWSDSLGIETLGVRPVRGQLVRLRWRGQPLPHILWSADCYVVPWTDGTILVGATVEDVGFEERVTAEGVRSLLDAVGRLLPAAGDATFLEARAGLRPASADGLPVIRASIHSPRVIFATGHYRNGILLAPLTAQKVLQLVEGLKG
jgi:glycine oxidase